MKRTILLAAVAGVATAFAVSVKAQTAASGSASQANNTANQVSASGAIASSGNLVYNEAATPSAQTLTTNGRTEVLASGSANAPAVFSGTHSCALGASAGLAGIAGNLTGLSAGATYTDKECEVRQEAMVLAGMGMNNIAMIHLATHDNEVRCTLVSQGVIRLPSGGDDGCGGKAQANVAASTTTSTRNQGVNVGGALASIAYGKCAYNAAGKIQLTVKRGADRDLAISQCKAALR